MHWPRVQGCENNNEAEPMRMEDVQGPFFVFFTLIFLAILGLMAEILLSKCCHHHKKGSFNVFNKNTKLIDLVSDAFLREENHEQNGTTRIKPGTSGSSV